MPADEICRVVVVGRSAMNGAPAWIDAFDELAEELDVLPASVAKARGMLEEWRERERMREAGLKADQRTTALAFKTVGQVV